LPIPSRARALWSGRSMSRVMARAWAWWSRAWRLAADWYSNSPRLLSVSAWPWRAPMSRNSRSACRRLAAAAGWSPVSVCMRPIWPRVLVGPVADFAEDGQGLPEAGGGGRAVPGQPLHLCEPADGYALAIPVDDGAIAFSQSTAPPAAPSAPNGGCAAPSAKPASGTPSSRPRPRTRSDHPPPTADKLS
jgi:hypothetical protein